MEADTSFIATIYRNLSTEVIRLHTHAEVRRLVANDLTITKVTKMVEGEEFTIFLRIQEE